MRTHGGATQAHMDAYVVPMSVNSDIGRSGLNRAIGRSGLNRAIGRSGLNRAIGRSGLNRAIGQSRLNRAIGRLKSHGVESASWATIPPITRDLTAEITRSEIRVMSHQFRAIRRLKSHGVKSASWDTIHQFRTNLSINRPHLQCKIHLLVSLLVEGWPLGSRLLGINYIRIFSYCLFFLCSCVFA